MVAKQGSLVQLILRYAPDGSMDIYSNPPHLKSSSEAVTQHYDWISLVIVLVTSTAAAIGGGGSKQVTAPATISGSFRSHGLVVCNMFAFSCALSALFLHRKPQAARVLRLSAIVWFSSAFLLLIYAVSCNRFS